jgi:hypothetical protein
MSWGAVKAASVRVVSRRKQIEDGSIFSVRQAAAACNVSPPVCGGGFRWGCFLRRHGQSSNCDVSAMSPIRSAIAVAPAPPTAPWRGGIGAVAALGAVKCKAMPLGHAVDARRKSGYP